MNQVDLIGRITNNLELRTGSNGTNYVFFTVAVNEYRGGKETTDFIPCVAFDKIAQNMVNFLSKGSLVGVSGRISVRNAENKDGQRLTSVNVNAVRVEFLERKGNGSQQSSNSNSDYVRDDSNIDMDVINGFEQENNDEQKSDDKSDKKDDLFKDDDSILWD